MHKKLWMIAAVLVAGASLSGCVPLVVAGGVVAADHVAEQNRGGDGLF